MSLKYKPIISSLEERQTYNVMGNGVISGGFIVSQIYPFIRKQLSSSYRFSWSEQKVPSSIFRDISGKTPHQPQIKNLTLHFQFKVLHSYNSCFTSNSYVHLYKNRETVRCFPKLPTSDLGFPLDQTQTR